jgi:hypothetical protein
VEEYLRDQGAFGYPSTDRAISVSSTRMMCLAEEERRAKRAVAGRVFHAHREGQPIRINYVRWVASGRNRGDCSRSTIHVGVR